jgi:hypothetical protein
MKSLKEEEGVLVLVTAAIQGEGEEGGGAGAGRCRCPGRGEGRVAVAAVPSPCCHSERAGRWAWPLSCHRGGVSLLRYWRVVAQRGRRRQGGVTTVVSSRRGKGTGKRKAAVVAFTAPATLSR